MTTMTTMTTMVTMTTKTKMTTMNTSTTMTSMTTLTTRISTNQGFLRTMHSLQCNCARDLFGHPRGWNLTVTRDSDLDLD